ncbi:MAG: hypothetical protein R3B45_16320 [Bdellovibrionota bacterium]
MEAKIKIIQKIKKILLKKDPIDLEEKWRKKLARENAEKSIREMKEKMLYLYYGGF